MDYNILKQDQLEIESKKELVDLLTHLRTYSSSINILPFSILNYNSIKKAQEFQEE